MTLPFRDNYLLFQLAIVSNAFSTDFHELLKRYGISQSKWRILVNILENPGIHITKLAEYTILEQSHVTRLTYQLCDEKLLEKRTSTIDRRCVGVWITERGRHVVLPLVDAAKSHEHKLLEKLQPEEAGALKDILAKLVAAQLKKSPPA